MYRFVRYVAPEFRDLNIALYEHDYGATLQAEKIESGRILRFRSFPTVAEGENWYDNVPGVEPFKMLNAIDLMRD
jgi:hypothetical protein